MRNNYRKTLFIVTQNLLHCHIVTIEVSKFMLFWIKKIGQSINSFRTRKNHEMTKIDKK